MRRVRMFILISFFCLVLISTSGCSVIQYVVDQFATADQTIDDSLQNLQKSRGFRSIVTGEEKQTLIRNGRTTRLNSHFHFQETFVQNPPAVYSIRQYTTNGQAVSSELYYQDGVAYQKMGSSGWQKEKGALTQLHLNYRPDELLQAVAAHIQNSGATLNTQHKYYLINVGKPSEQVFLTQMEQEFVTAFRQLSADFERLNKVPIKRERFSQKIYINKQSKRLQKIQIELTLSAQINQTKFVIERTNEIRLVGDQDKPIVVPEEIKSNAIGTEDQLFPNKPTTEK